jgi:hypothetical protein
VAREVVGRARHAPSLEISGRGDRHAPRRPDPPGDERGIGQVAHPDRDVDSLFNEIYEAVAHDEFHAHLG